jgi:hypothetical protein
LCFQFLFNCERIQKQLCTNFHNMVDDLSTLWENFSLTEDKDLVLAIPKGELREDVSLGLSCVVGKLIGDRIVSKEAIQNSLIQWWQPKGNVSFKIIGENRFVVEFELSCDKEPVLAGRPWAFEGSLFIVEDFDGITPPSKFTFEKVAFWVQMIDMPLACMNAEIENKIRASVGEVEAVDTDSRGIG